MFKVTKTFALCGLAFLGVSNVYANHADLEKFEQQIIQKYKNSDYFAVNGEIEEAISNKISQDSSSLTYEFPNLQKNNYVSIKYSPDKKLKFYTFDVSGGGTMGEWYSDVQYKTNNVIHVDEFTAGSILDIKQVNIGNKTIYLIQSYYKGDSCHGLYNLRAVEIGSKQLLKAYVFEDKNKKSHEIDVEYDCHYDQDRNGASSYLRIHPKTIDVMLLNENFIPQNKYLRYSLGKTGYRYTGIVK